MKAKEAKFCLRCGTGLEMAHRAGRQRPSCPNCGWIFFPDPKVAVAALIEHEGKVLLVQRAHNPHRGKWTLPAGFVDAGEDPAQAAEREVREETSLHVRADELLDVIPGHIPPKGAHILILYRGVILEGNLEAGDDAAQAVFFAPNDLPPLAFKSTKEILEKYL